MTLNAIAQAELLRRDDVSPRELAEAAIRRIERVNPQLNANIECQFDKALRRAEAKDLSGLSRALPYWLRMWS
ncbi:amidase family protein [Pseudomonas sp. BN414]|uniref:amidase family protein n=1 Tax=Pseudomonas sp. BN414 TaxID=2567888 RepID=UPI002453A419|nr:amidase family protein [Pseudomonas sp. BN414]